MSAETTDRHYENGCESMDSLELIKEMALPEKYATEPQDLRPGRTPGVKGAGESLRRKNGQRS
jgi:hypothetical protein